jgi:hypothetical protein
MKNKLFAFCVSFLLLSCKESEEYLLIKKLNSITNNTNNHFNVVILSESHCSSCISQLRKKITSDRYKDYIFYGIYSKSSNVNHLKYLTTDQSLPLKWHQTYDIQLMNQLYKFTSDAIGPYMLRIENNKITRVF